MFFLSYLLNVFFDFECRSEGKYHGGASDYGSASIGAPSVSNCVAEAEMHHGGRDWNIDSIQGAFGRLLLHGCQGGGPTVS